MALAAYLRSFTSIRPLLIVLAGACAAAALLACGSAATPVPEPTVAPTAAAAATACTRCRCHRRTHCRGDRRAARGCSHLAAARFGHVGARRRANLGAGHVRASANGIGRRKSDQGQAGYHRSGTWSATGRLSSGGFQGNNSRRRRHHHSGLHRGQFGRPNGRDRIPPVALRLPRVLLRRRSL